MFGIDASSVGYVTLFAVLGVTMGSFGNVLIARLPRGASLGGRSHCMNCKHTLTWLELVPLVSYVFLRGKCRECRHPISMRYPLVEAVSSLLFIAAYVHTLSLGYGILLSLALWALLLIALIDLSTHLIPDMLTFIAGMSGLAMHVPGGSVSFLSPLIGFLFFGMQWLFSRGKWVGSGDILLAVAIGAMLNDWRLMILCLMAAYILGGGFAAWLLATKRVDASRHVPFGPFLSVGAVIMVFFGERIASVMIPW